MSPLKSWRSIVGITVHQRICINIYWDRVQSFCITSAFSDMYSLCCCFLVPASVIMIWMLCSPGSQFFQIVWRNLERVSKFFLLLFCISLKLWCKINIRRKLDAVSKLTKAIIGLICRKHFIGSLNCYTRLIFSVLCRACHSTPCRKFNKFCHLQGDPKNCDNGGPWENIFAIIHLSNIIFLRIILHNYIW